MAFKPASSVTRRLGADKLPTRGECAVPPSPPSRAPVAQFRTLEMRDCGNRSTPSPHRHDNYVPRLEALEQRLVLTGGIAALSDPTPVVEQTFTSSLVAGEFEESFLLAPAADGTITFELEESNIPLQLELFDPDSLLSLGLATRPVFTPSLFFPTGPNDSIPTATASNLTGPGAATTSGFIGDGAFGSTTGDYDIYSFSADAGLRVDVDILATIGLDSVIAVFDADGNLIAQNDDDGLTTDSFVSFITPTDCDYYVAVYGKGTGLPSDPFVTNSGGGVGSTGNFDLLITIQEKQSITIPAIEGKPVLAVVAGVPGADIVLNVTNNDAFSSSSNAVYSVATGGTPDDVLVEDINGDSIADLLVVDNATQRLALLLGNGDGTFQTPQVSFVGAGTQATDPFRSLVSGEANGDSWTDIFVTNPNSSDISVLDGNSDGFLDFHRRYDSARTPGPLAVGDFNDDGELDIVVADATADGNATISILAGRGDGTFEPQNLLVTSFDGFTSLSVDDFDDDGNLDVALFAGEGKVVFALGNGDGTLTVGPILDAPGILGEGIVQDVDGDGKFDIVATLPEQDGVFFRKGTGILTFDSEVFLSTGPNPWSIAVGDVASPGLITALSTGLGAADGNLDLIVGNRGRADGEGNVVVLTGGSVGLAFDPAVKLTDAESPTAITIADVDGDSQLDVVVAEQSGVLIVFGDPPSIIPNTTALNATDLGEVQQLVLGKRTLLSGITDSFFKFTVPEESATGQDQVVDISVLLENLGGPGLGVQIFDSIGTLLSSATRQQLVVPQGEELLIRVFSLVAGPVVGSGAFTLAINILPQVVSIDANALLTTDTGAPAGPVTNLTVTLQGNFLDRASAQDPNNYTITFLGDDGILGTGDDEVISLGTTDFPIIYTPNANLDVSFGQSFPTQTRQTITLNFDRDLPVGDYLVTLSSDIQTVDFITNASDLLVADPIGVQPLVSVDGLGNIVAGVTSELIDLVLEPGDLDLTAFEDGTAFLTQLQNDLSSLLDSVLTELGDASSVTDTILEQLEFRIDAGVGAVGERSTSLLVLFLDPVSFGLADPSGDQVQYDLETNDVTSNVPKTYVEVGGNVELIIVSDAVGTYGLDVANVPTQPRGVAGALTNSGTTFTSLTPDLRAGVTRFDFVVANGISSPGGGGIGNPSNPSGPSNPSNPSGPAIPGLFNGVTFIVVTETSSTLIFSLPQADSELSFVDISESQAQGGEVSAEPASTTEEASSRRDDPRAAAAGLRIFLRDRLPELATGLWDELVLQLQNLWNRFLGLGTR